MHTYITAINECLHVYQVVCVSRRRFVDYLEKSFAETALRKTSEGSRRADLAVPFLIQLIDSKNRFSGSINFAYHEREIINHVFIFLT